MNGARRLFRQAREVCLKWLHSELKDAFAIRTHLTIEERIALRRLAAGAEAVGEIGSYVGASACCFGAALAETGKGKIICIDTWNNDAMSEGNRDTWAEFTENTFRFRHLIIPIRGLSTDVPDRVRTHTSRFDVLFIDGDHSYAGVKADWDAYKGFLEPGATVIFHDYGWAEGVRRVVEEEVAPIAMRHGSLPNMWWGTVGNVP